MIGIASEAIEKQLKREWTRKLYGVFLTVHMIDAYFELLGQVSDVKNIAENIAAVAESVAESSGLSAPRRCSELAIPQTSFYRISH